MSNAALTSPCSCSVHTHTDTHNGSLLCTTWMSSSELGCRGGFLQECPKFNAACHSDEARKYLSISQNIHTHLQEIQLYVHLFIYSFPSNMLVPHHRDLLVLISYKPPLTQSKTCTVRNPLKGEIGITTSTKSEEHFTVHSNCRF